MNYPIYLDYNSTTPVLKEVLDKMLPYYLEHFGNAASKSHPYGWMVENAVEQARENVARLIGAKAKEIIFTSGATEAINLAIKGICELYSNDRPHIISCQTEHKAVLDTLKSVEKKGAEITLLPVDKNGQISLIELESSIKPETRMIVLMWANNETGVIFPIESIAEIAERHKIIFFTDAVQAVGKIPVHVHGVHMMAISAHKFYGPKGVGALFIRHNNLLPKPVPLIDGGGHEKGFRSGTLNVPGIVGMGKAAELASIDGFNKSDRLENLRNKLEKAILELPETSLNIGQSRRLSHVTNISFGGIEGEDLLRELNKEIAVSSGSACTSISPKPSHVLAAMGVDSDLARASVRFSLGKMTTELDIEKAISVVKEVLSRLR
ncbi:cysteine desulfurase [Belliella sp. R4-6]|uniref:cysteine desulfurase n=1 Tax=Belliella alkalica TaxID=1730871 RepID=A0ABS9V692_9BACT|nr:cysteine desulfurase family protein [Belliella alkalica]MCH7411929.1 cysteine desulfurase [Belliella alkalica]